MGLNREDQVQRPRLGRSDRRGMAHCCEDRRGGVRNDLPFHNGGRRDGGEERVLGGDAVQGRGDEANESGGGGEVQQVSPEV